MRDGAVVALCNACHWTPFRLAIGAGAPPDAPAGILGVYRVHVRIARPCGSARRGKFIKAAKVLR